jgi:ankyrin repeat protein
VQWCLAQPGAPELSARDKDGYTALASAVSNLRFEVAEFLIEAGTDLTLTGSDSGTILHSLARLPPSPATVKLVDMVLARSVALTEVRDAFFFFRGMSCSFVEAVDRHGETPLMVAVGNMNDSVLMCLLKRGAAVGKANLYVASCKCHSLCLCLTKCA